MSVKGVYVAQECHVVNLIPPVSLNATTTTTQFSMKGWRHATIVLQIGVSGTAPSVTLNTSDNGSPANTTSGIPFNLHKCETAYNATGGDVLGPRVAESASGFTVSATDNIFYVIELDSDTLPQGQDFVDLVLTSPGTCLTAASVILSGGRFEHDQSESVLTF